MMKKLYIEPTTRCNLNCKMCFRNTWFDEPICDLSLQDYEHVLKTMPDSVETIFFGGMGEPLVHKDIFTMIRMASEAGKNVEMLTNGTLLSEKVINELIDQGLNRLWVSIDNLDDRAGQTDAGHGNSNAVLKSLQLFNTIRELRLSPITLGVAFVAMKSNVHQLGRLPRFIAKYLVDEVNISNVYPLDESSEEEMLYTRVAEMYRGIPKGFGQLVSVVRMPFLDMRIPEVAEGVSEMAGNMNFDLYFNDQPVIRKTEYCRFIKEGMCYVRSDGNVAPCMELLHNGVTMLGKVKRKVYYRSFGNIKEKALSDIWDSKVYQSFRGKLEDFDYPDCIHCIHCDFACDNTEDCLGNSHPTCGGCLWSEGVLSCP